MHVVDAGARGTGRKRRRGGSPEKAAPKRGCFKPVPMVDNGSPGPVEILEKVENTPSVGCGKELGYFISPARERRSFPQSVLPQFRSRSSGEEKQSGQPEGEEASEAPRAQPSVRRLLSGSLPRAWRLLERCMPVPRSLTLVPVEDARQSAGVPLHQGGRPWGVGGMRADSVFGTPRDGVQSPSLFLLAAWNHAF